jgi:MFS family permease
VLASLLMLSGSTADRLGRKRVFVAGLGVFSLASLLCSLAPNVELLVAFRVLQAVGGSMLNPVAMSIIANTFTDPRERRQAVGIWGAVFGISMALGPIVGGTVVDAFGWRPIFWINLPVGLAAIALTLRLVPESRAPPARRFDPVGQVLVIVLLAALTFGIIEAPALGWSSPPSWPRSRRRRPRWRAADLRAAPRGAARRPAVLPLDPVRVGDRDLGRRVRGVRRLPVPQHAVPAGRARLLAAGGRARHRAAGAG